jgi:hypothetical protein
VRICEELRISSPELQKYLDFLLSQGLLAESKGRLVTGSKSIYLPPTDPLTQKNHQNWRLLSLERMQSTNDESFFYSGQYTLSNEVAEQIRIELPDFIDSILKKVVPSKSETARCLNIDFFKL